MLDRGCRPIPNHDLIPKRTEYYVQTGSMFENPYGVPHDEIVAQLLEMPSEVAAQVIFGKYVESSGLVFSGELIQMLFDRSAEHYGSTWDHTFRITSDRWYDEAAVAMSKAVPWANRRYRYATGVDFARKTDFTVLFTLDLLTRPARVIYYKRLNRVPWESIYREVGRAVDLFGPSVLADSTGMAGDIIMENLESRLYCPVHDRTLTLESGLCRDQNHNAIGGCIASEFRRLACVEGYAFSASSKTNLMEHLRNSMSAGYRAGSDEPFGLLRCPPIVQVEEEMAFYAWDDKGLDTDTVMALALAAWQGLEDVPAPAAVGSAYGS